MHYADGDRGCNCRMPVYRLERKICQASLQPKTQTNYEIKIYEINIYIYIYITL